MTITPNEKTFLKQSLFQSLEIELPDVKKSLLLLLSEAADLDRPQVLAFPEWQKDILGRQVVEAAQTLGRPNSHFMSEVRKQNIDFKIAAFSEQPVWSFDDGFIKWGIVISSAPISTNWQSSLAGARFTLVNNEILAKIRRIEVPLAYRPPAAMPGGLHPMAA